MTISNLKELSKLIDLCRKKGIDSISIDNVQIKLGQIRRKVTDKEANVTLASVPEYSEEDIIGWSTHNYEGAG